MTPTRSLCSSMVALLVLVSVVHAETLTVSTKYGPVTGAVEVTAQGSSTEQSSLVWRGIRYAAPPVGSLRWEDPVAPTPWSSPVDATTFGPGCPQDCDLPPHTCPTQVSEDCLYLNVWAPRGTSSSSNLPVMFFIHGGHYEQGSGEGPAYDSTAAANTTGVVTVTINYRLGVLGFLYTGAGGVTGNFAIKDQIFALQWVIDNIANFGGNPQHITIYGQSAGGTSVSTLLVSPLTKGMFQRAIVESNPFGLPITSSSDGLRLAKRVTQDSGCGDEIDVQCLRGLSAQQLVTAQKSAGKIFNIKDLLELFYPWTPVIDSTVVTDQPLNLFLQQKQHSVPIMMGNVQEEGRVFVYSAFPKGLDELEYGGIVIFNWGLHFLEVLDMYPHSSSGDNRDVMSQLATDYLFVCPARAAARAIANQNPTYLYLFDHAFSFNGWGANYTFCNGHVCHAEELPFVFDIANNGIFQFSPAEVKLGHDMVTAWSNFGKTSNPQVSGWNPMSSSTSTDVKWHWVTPSPGSNIANFHSKYCDFWDKLGYHF